MTTRMRGMDWTAHALGPPQSWAETLRITVGLLLRSRFPMFVAWGPELRFIYNDAYAPMLGTKHPAALGEPFERIWSEVWPVVGPLADGVLRGEASYVEDLLLVMLRRGFAEETYFTFSYSPLGDAAGAGLFCAVTETTGRVIGERRLRVLRELGEVSAVTAASVTDACSAAVRTLAGHRADVPFALIYLLDPDGRSARLVASSGIRPDGAIAPSTLPDSGGRGTEIWAVARTGRATVLTGLAARYAESILGAASAVGDAPPDTALILPLGTGAQGRPTGVLVAAASPYLLLDEEYRAFLDLLGQQVSTALTDALAYATQRRRAEELAELDRAKTMFFSNISHEFRTPLTLLMGPLEELRAAHADDARLRAELDIVHRNGLRLGKLVNSLLDFSRIQAGRIQAGYEPVDLGVLTTELAGVFRSAMERAGLGFVVDCADIGEPVYVDREMWEKVVLNLLSNALKFTFDGTVTVTLREESGAAVLRVTDTGIGIPAEEMPRLFERFHRVPRARARSAEGSGIGLALVKELVRLHGGAIGAESAVDVGTTISITVPLGMAHLPADKVLPAAAADREVAAEPYVTEALRWLPADDPAVDDPAAGDPLAEPGERAGAELDPAGRVLIADDNADMRDYLRRLLSGRYRIEAVGDGSAALLAARADPPDLLLTDVMMPGMDGIELVAALRGDPATATVPVLLLSARAGQEAAIEGLAAGADDYLVKPFSAAELRARVGAHVRLGRERRAAERRFRAMADLAPALIWICDATGARMFHNSGWVGFTGRDQDDERGSGWCGGLHPDDAERYHAVTTAALAAGEPWQIEYRLRRSDGVYHWLLENAVPIGPAAGYVGSCVDVHLPYRETQRQTMLAELSAALDTETDVRLRAQRLARLVVDSRLADQCSVLLVSGGRLDRAAAAAADPARETALCELAAVNPVAEQVYETGRELFLPELEDDVRLAGDLDPEQRELRRQVGVRSEIMLPLTARGRVHGVLALGRSAESPRFTRDDLGWAGEVAGRAGIALDNALLLAAESVARRAAERFGEMVGTLSGATDLAEVAQVILKYAESLGAETAVVMLCSEGEPGRLTVLAPTAAPADQDLAVHAAHPLAYAVRSAEPVWAEPVWAEPVWAEPVRAEPVRTEPVRTELVRTEPDEGWLSADVALPLVVDGVAIGVVGLRYADPVPTFGFDEQTMIRAVIGQCAQAMERARLQRAERSARAAAEAAAARLGALVSGLAAIVWEADVGCTKFTFVSERAEELLGYPRTRWLDEDGFWPSVIHPDDRDEAIRICQEATAAGQDHAFSYRARHADGRVLWLQDVVHVLCDADGTPQRLQGVMTDITEEKRAEQGAALLADAGRVLAESAELDAQLAALARLTTGPLGDCTIVSLLGDDGLLRHIASAHLDPELEPLLARAAHTQPPDAVLESYRSGAPFIVPEITDAVRRAGTVNEDDYQARIRLGSHTALVVPLAVRGQVLGAITFATADPARHYDDPDLALAQELGRRASAAIEAHQLRDRARQLQLMTTALASAATVAEAARALAACAARAFNTDRIGVYRVTSAGRLRLVHLRSYPEGTYPDRFTQVDVGQPLPLADAVRTREPLWIETVGEFRRRYPDLARTIAQTGTQAICVLPMLVAGEVIGALVLSFGRPKTFLPDQRDLAVSLAGQAAQAFERAAAADERQRIADILQHSLLPDDPPQLARLAFAQRYLPGAEGSQAGGDWYDVLPLDADRVAIVVGDVVGKGARAAAVMGQLRSSLASYLLEGHPPAAALERLDRFAQRIEGARASSVLCLIVEVRTGELCWAGAGHPPPLVIEPGGARFLVGGTGAVLGFRCAFAEGQDRIEPGDTVLLYTDGLVERRGEMIDDGLARLAAAAAGFPDLPPDLLAARLLEQVLTKAGPADDVAMVLARLIPPPLAERLPADPVQLSWLRRAVTQWARRAALPTDLTNDLQLALGEAAANAVEHAYPPDAPGEFDYEITREPGGAVAVRIADRGRWRPPPANPGPRGRGLAIIRSLGQDVTLDHGPGGTRLRFRIRPAVAADEHPPAHRPVAPLTGAVSSAVLSVSDSEPGQRIIRVHGDLDLAGVREVGPALLTQLGPARIGPGAAVTLDLRNTGYLGSVGVDLLAHAAQLVQDGGGRLRVRVTPDGLAARILALSGLDTVLCGTAPGDR